MPAARKPAGRRKAQPHRDGAKPFLVYLLDEQLERLDAHLAKTGEARASFARRAITKLLRTEEES